MRGRGIRSRGRLPYAVALALFLGVSWAAWRGLPPVQLHGWWLAGSATLVSFTLVLNGIEYVLAGRLLRHHVDLGSAIRVTVLASAANLLPLPGGVLVRSEALRRRGADLPGALRSNAAIGFAWVAAGLLLAGIIQFSVGGSRLGWVMLLSGVTALSVAGALARVSRRWLSWLLLVLGLEIVFVFIVALRLLFVLRGLGISCTVPQALTIAVAEALASAAGLFPGGLGLREALAAGFATIIGVPAATGAAAAAADRLIGLLPLTIAAAFLMPRRPRSPAGKNEDAAPVSIEGGT